MIRSSKVKVGRLSHHILSLRIQELQVDSYTHFHSLTKFHWVLANLIGIASNYRPDKQLFRLDSISIHTPKPSMNQSCDVFELTSTQFINNMYLKFVHSNPQCLTWTFMLTHLTCKVSSCLMIDSVRFLKIKKEKRISII